MSMLGGFVTSPKLFIGKNKIIDEDGLLSQRIFGPINDYKCICGKLAYSLDRGNMCPKCKVMCDTNELRVKIFGKIKSVFPIIKSTKKHHILKLIGAKNKVILNPIQSDANLSLKKYLAIDGNGEKVKIVDNIKEPNYYVVPLRITGIYSFILVLKYLRNNFLNQMPVVDTINEFFEKEYITNEIKVLPPEIRPVIPDPKNPKSFIVSEVNKHYTSLLQLNKANNLYASNIPVDEEYWLGMIDVNFRNQIHDEIVEFTIMDYDVTTSKYQFYVDVIYDTIFDIISKKKGFIRSTILSKTIEFSARTVIVVDPSIEPYQIRVSKKILFKLWKLQFIHYLTNVKKIEYDECFERIVTKKYEEVADIFNEFCDWFCSNEYNI